MNVRDTATGASSPESPCADFPLWYASAASFTSSFLQGCLWIIALQQLLVEDRTEATGLGVMHFVSCGQDPVGAGIPGMPGTDLAFHCSVPNDQQHLSMLQARRDSLR
jgi:hypothetical protein